LKTERRRKEKAVQAYMKPASGGGATA